jgi:signal peptidase I
MGEAKQRQLYGATSTPKMTKPGSLKREISAQAVWLIVVVIIFLIIRTFIIQPFNVPSSSMYPNLLIGDIEIVTKWNYGFSKASLPFGHPMPTDGQFFGHLPRRGDVIVFRWANNTQESWVKRVIALPGDTIMVDDGIPELIGQTPTIVIDTHRSFPCATDLCKIYKETIPGGQPHLIALDPSRPLNRYMPAITIPPGMLFVMGDNRDDSADSRVAWSNGGAGLVPLANVEGKDALVIFNVVNPEHSFTIP